MSNKLIEYFLKIASLTEPEIEAINESMTVKRFKKGHLLLEAGQRAPDTYFVLEGCIRQYYLVDGEEKTNNFFTESQWVINVTSPGKTGGADYYLECCEDTEVVVGNEQKETPLFEQFARLETISRRVMENVFALEQEKMANYFTDTPEQRYVRLMQSRPDLFQRIPQYQLASYIGVKPESLSRIRKRIISR